MLYDPADVVASVITVNVVDPDPATEVGEMLQAFAGEFGQPVTTKSTVPENPFNADTFTLDVALCPWVSVSEPGDVEIEKSAVAVLLQSPNLKEAILVLHRYPSVGWYSVVYQNVQSSTGSTVMLL